MRPKEKNSGRHRQTANATLADRRNMLQPLGHIVGIANTSNSSPARDRLACSVWRHSGFEIGAGWQRPSRPSGDDTVVRLDDPPSQDVVRHACTRFRGETGQDDHPHNAPRLCAWTGFERGRLRPLIQVD